MLILTVVGIVALVFGILILAVPGTVKRWSKAMDKVLVSTDEKIEKYKVSVGIISTAVGIVALFLVYYHMK